MNISETTEIGACLDATTETIGLLVDLLKEESEAVQSHDMVLVSTLQQRKTSLSQLYERQIDILRKRSAEVTALSRDRLAPLATSRERLSIALAANLRALDTAKHAAQRMFNIISESVRRCAGGVDSYSPAGRSNIGTGGSCVSVTLDSTL